MEDLKRGRSTIVSQRLIVLWTRIMNILTIDTSESKTVVIGLTHKGKTYCLRSQKDTRKPQDVLPMIDELLAKRGLVVYDIEQIEVNTGPGSFTGLRVGAAIANALGTLLHIPINDQKPGELIKPRY